MVLNGFFLLYSHMFRVCFKTVDEGVNLLNCPLHLQILLHLASVNLCRRLRVTDERLNSPAASFLVLCTTYKYKNPQGNIHFYNVYIGRFLKTSLNEYDKINGILITRDIKRSINLKP